MRQVSASDWIKSTPRPSEAEPLVLPTHPPARRRPRRRRAGSPPGRRSFWIGQLGAAFFLLAALVFALVTGGHFSVRGSTLKAVVDQSSMLVGLSAQHIVIAGLERQSGEAVLRALGVEEGSSLIGFDAGKAREVLERLDWVAQASVLRLFPNRLRIEIVERRPFALWQANGAFSVIDRDGVAMPSLPVKDYRHLPVVVGDGANEAAAALVNQLEAQPALKSMVLAAVRVADRRWALHLNNTIRVDLPEEGVAEALALLMSMIDRYGIMTRDIVSIDLRLSDRVGVRLSDEAVEKLKGKRPQKVSNSG